jgi:hypothetical protein
MLAAGSRVVMVDRDEAGLKTLCNKRYPRALYSVVGNFADA